MDKEYILLNEIDKNEDITQRELSKRTNLSLGSVNILLNKMIHEGLVKIKHIPMNRVAYMLTPIGIAEKVKKTSNYIKVHYNYINETIKKIQSSLVDIAERNNCIGILLEQDEISELIKQAVADIPDKYKLKIFICNDLNKVEKHKTDGIVYIAISIQSYEYLKSLEVNAINILELI